MNYENCLVSRKMQLVTVTKTWKQSKLWYC